MRVKGLQVETISFAAAPKVSLTGRYNYNFQYKADPLIQMRMASVDCLSQKVLPLTFVQRKLYT